LHTRSDARQQSLGYGDLMEADPGRSAEIRCFRQLIRCSAARAILGARSCNQKIFRADSRLLSPEERKIRCFFP
jgi:hypothetical protein